MKSLLPSTKRNKRFPYLKRDSFSSIFDNQLVLLSNVTVKKKGCFVQPFFLLIKGLFRTGACGIVIELQSIKRTT